MVFRLMQKKLRNNRYRRISTEDFDPFKVFSKRLKNVCLLISMPLWAGNKSVLPHSTAEVGRQISPPRF